jgi:hypothetical protein
VFISVAAATPFLPDYETYRSIYETGGGHLTVLGRDLGFVFLVQLLSPIVGYNNFRWLLLIIIAGVLIFSLRKLQLSSSKRLGVSLVMALVPLILLKFGAQIREGIALLIWLSIIFTNNRRPSWLIFTPVALISVSIHLATLPLWMLLGLNYYLPNRPTLALVLGALLYAAFTYLVADISRLNEELFRGLSQDSVNPNLFTAAYWLFYPLVFFSSIFRSNPVNSNQAGGGIPFIALDFVLRAAMIGFLVGITLQVGLTGQAFFVKGAVADSIRLAALLLSLYCISLAARGRHRYATLLALFLIVDTIRIMLAA